THAGPGVRATGSLPRVSGPRVVPKLTGPRNRVKRPPNSSGAYIVGANVTGRRSFALSYARALDEKILIDDTRTCRNDERVTDVAAESDGKVHRAAIAEANHWSTGTRVE